MPPKQVISKVLGAQRSHICFALLQARYLDAVRLHGRDPKLIAKAMGNRTIGACKKFWSKVGQISHFRSS